MATKAPKNPLNPARKTVMPLFIEQHGTLDEETDELIECFVEDCGTMQLYDQPPPGSKKARTLVPHDDYWLPGWETDSKGKEIDPDDVDDDEVKKFVLHPLTTPHDLEKQFGQRHLYISACWGPHAPEGKSGLMKGGHAFSTGGDGPKRRGLPIVDESEEEEETEEDEERIEELEGEVEELKAKLAEAAAAAAKPAPAPPPPPPPPPTPLQQVRDLKEAADIFATKDSMSASREQHWKDMLDDERRNAEKNLAAMRTIGETNLATLRSELSGAQTVLVNRYEEQLGKLRAENQSLVTTMAAQLSEARSENRKELERRDALADGSVASLKTRLSNTEGEMSKLRMETDSKISTLIGESNTMLLSKSLAVQERDFVARERDAAVRDLAAAVKERDNLRNIEKELNESIFVMKRERSMPAAPEHVEARSGFNLHPMVSMALMAGAPVAVFMLIKWMMDTGKPVPPEAKAAYEQWKREQEAGQQQAQQQAAYEESERQRAEEERETRRRSDEYEAEQARIRAREAFEREEQERIRAEEAERMRASVAEAERVEREKQQQPSTVVNGEPAVSVHG